MKKKEELKKIGNMVKLARKRNNLSQIELAHRINKDQPSINRLEKGRINPSYIYLLEICEGLNIELCELLKNK